MPDDGFARIAPMRNDSFSCIDTTSKKRPRTTSFGSVEATGSEIVGPFGGRNSTATGAIGSNSFFDTTDGAGGTGTSVGCVTFGDGGITVGGAGIAGGGGAGALGFSICTGGGAILGRREGTLAGGTSVGG